MTADTLELLRKLNEIKQLLEKISSQRNEIKQLLEKVSSQLPPAPFKPVRIKSPVVLGED